MTSLNHALRALALSFSLTAAGVFCVVGAASPSPAATSPSPAATSPSPAATTPSPAAKSTPLGGPQLGKPGVIVNRRPGVPPPPAMPGASFLLADLDTGQILVARAPHTPRRPASTLKTLTALTLMPLLDKNTRITAQAQDARAEGSHLGLLAGSSYSVVTLLQGMLMASGNDAAYALARGNRSVPETLRAMNATAAHLNAFETVAKDPSGLDKAGQTSSAYDLALISRAAMKLPDFRTYVIRKKASLGGGRTASGKPTPGFKISSHNRLLYNYRGAIGIKSGYTRAAKHTYVGAATRGGKTYLVTQMGSPTGSWRPTAALLDWAFANGSSLTPVGNLVEPGNLVGSGNLVENLVEPGNLAGSGDAATPKPTLAPGAAPKPPPNPSPGNTALEAAFPPWVGVAALISALTLAVAWRGRHLSRKRISGGRSSQIRD